MKDVGFCAGSQPFMSLEAKGVRRVMEKREGEMLVKETGIPALLLLQGSGMVLGKLLFMHNEGLDFPGPQGEG